MSFQDHIYRLNESDSWSEGWSYVMIFWDHVFEAVFMKADYA